MAFDASKLKPGDKISVHVGKGAYDIATVVSIDALRGRVTFARDGFTYVTRGLYSVRSPSK